MKSAIAVILICLSFGLNGYGQNIDSLATSRADTSRFSINQPGGWVLYNSFAEKAGNDSIRLMVIIRHERGNLDWRQYQLFGKIKTNNLRPAADREVSYRLMKDVYKIKIAKTGDCYLRLENGELPPGNPTILPVDILFPKHAR